jgi:hypothetical protein
VICTDPDGDDLESRLSQAPERGTLAGFDTGPLSLGYWGAERWLDMTYVPDDESPRPDPFAMTASGARGEGPESQMAIVPRPEWQNGGLGCGWSPADSVVGEPAVAQISCNDDEGDTLSAEVVLPARHGTTLDALITPGLYGSSDISIPYVPDPGYEGFDCIKVRISDGYGSEITISVDIWIRPKPLPIELPPLPVDPPLPDVDISSPAAVRRLAERALGAGSVRKVLGTRDAQVWTARKLSRRDLRRFGQSPAVFVVCRARCQIRSAASAKPGIGAPRAHRRQSALSAMGGQPQVLFLEPPRREMRALRRVRQGRFRLTIHTEGRRLGPLVRTIPVGP